MSRFAGTRRMSPRRVASVLLRYLCVGLFLFWIVFPFWFTFVSSLTTPAQLAERPFGWMPNSITFGNFAILTGASGGGGLTSGGGGASSGLGTTGAGSSVIPALAGSWFVGLAAVLVALIVGGLAAYALARLPFRGSRTMYGSMLVSRIVPGFVLIGPLFIFMRVLGLLNTPWALIVVYNIFTLPFAVIVLRDYVRGLPVEVEEAARVDGAGLRQVLWHVVIPMATPGIVAAGALVFLEAWSEFYFALILTPQLTIPPVVVSLQKLYQFTWNTVAAGTVAAILPPLIVVFVFQRLVINTLGRGAIK